jgi:hypothetical protein
MYNSIGMALVDYSSSSSDSEPPRKRLPQLPAEFHDLYASTVRVANVDDPSLHGGRERGVEHRAGQWPTHVYLECKISFTHGLFQGYAQKTRANACVRFGTPLAPGPICL